MESEDRGRSHSRFYYGESAAMISAGCMAGWLKLGRDVLELGYARQDNG